MACRRSGLLSPPIFVFGSPFIALKAAAFAAVAIRVAAIAGGSPSRG